MKHLIKKIVPPQAIAIARISFKEIERLFRFEKKIQTKLPLSQFSNKDADTFFGYYDVTPFNSQNDIVYLEKDKTSDIVNIILNNINNTKKRIVAKSRAWNWQQGSRLRWMPGSDDTISFNDFDGRSYFNRILNLDSNKEQRIDWPLYDIDNFGKYGISLNFERLGVLRPGYGYTCKEYLQNTSDLPNDGICIIDLAKNIEVKKITYKVISSVCKDGVSFDHCYINHLAFSPSGQRFLFFWIQIVGGYHKASLVVYDIPTDRIVPLELDLKASHYVWANDDLIICTSYERSGTCRYYKYHINDVTKSILCPNSLKEDGHPSMLTTEGSMITDTYPDNLYFQHIYKVDTVNDEKKELIKIYSDPHITGEQRTDLHPRLNRSQTLVAFDANVRGYRSLYILNLK